VLLTRLDGLRTHAAAPATAMASETLQRCTAAKRAADEHRPGDAIIALRAAAWLDEASPLPHQYLANIHFLSGHPFEAVREQREALKRDPGNDLYRRNLASLEQALAAQPQRTQ
jgi:hypothetical protein